MMKHAFLSISYQHRDVFIDEITCVVDVLRAAGVTTTVFVRKYQFDSDQQHAMMATTRTELEQADVIIAEVTHKAIGVGIEIGFAWARDIPVIYLRRAGAEPSTTVGGVATCTVAYQDLDNLRSQLRMAVEGLK